MTRAATAGAPRVASETAEPQLEIRTPIAAAIYFVLSLAYFLPAFAPGRQIYGTDYLGGGYMFYHFIGERLAAGALPKWVPYVFGGMPLAANPGSTYHPVHFIADLLLPTSKVLAAVFVVHFWIAGLGMYLLARELESRRWVAFVSGLAFQFTGITMSWVYAGHDGRIMVATMAPLFFYCLHRGVRTARLAPFAGAAATLGFALLSFQIQNSYYLLLAGAIWAAFLLVRYRQAHRPAVLGRVVAVGLGAVVLGFLLAAVNFLPFLDYVPESPRGSAEGRGYEFSTSFSMPPAEVVALAVPEQQGASVFDPEAQRPLFPEYHGPNGFKLHTEYVGAFVVVLLALGAYYSRRDAYWWFFLGLVVFAMTIALGGHTPLYRLYYAVLPGTKQFRAPSLSFFIVALSLVAMAARTLERLARQREAADRSVLKSKDTDTLSAAPLARLPWIAGGVVAIAVLGALFAGGDAGAVPGAPTAAQGWARFALFAGLVGATLWLWTSRRVAPFAAAAVLAIVTFTDLWTIDRKFFHTVPGPEVVFAADDVTNFLRSQSGEFRIWTFPYPQIWRGAGAYGGNYPMLFGLDQVAGEHPNPLRTWVEYVGAGERTYIDWHNLITEAAVVDTPEGQAIGFQSVPGFLNAINVRYLVSTAPLAHPDLREVYRGSALVYENTAALPRAYLVPEVQVAPGGPLTVMRSGTWDPRRLVLLEATPPAGLPQDGPLSGEAQLVEYTPDRIVVRTTASRPALLVLADNYYEGWTATVSGAPAEVVRVNHTLRGVMVGEGTHEVVFTYQPRDLYVGLGVTLAGLALLAGYGVVVLLRSRRGASREAAAA